MLHMIDRPERLTGKTLTSRILALASEFVEAKAKENASIRLRIDGNGTAESEAKYNLAWPKAHEAAKRLAWHLLDAELVDLLALEAFVIVGPFVLSIQGYGDDTRPFGPGFFIPDGCRARGIQANGDRIK